MTKKRFTRWLFYDPSSPDESAFHQSLSEKIDAWWRAFVDRCDDIDALFRQGTDWDLPKWMEQHLQCIHPRLMWEYGPAVRTNGHRLVITPEAARHLRPLTNTILERAPQLTGWEFYAYRLPENLEKAQLTVEARTGGTIQDLLFQSRTGKDHRIDLAFYSPRTSAQDDPQALNDAFVAVESLLGEERLDRWIGAIEVALLGADQRKSRLLPLSQLHERVGALVGQVIDQQPSEPFFKRIETLEWTMYRLEPDEAEDYPTQSDIFVAKSVHPALWSAAHCGTSFCSERFSKNAASSFVI